MAYAPHSRYDHHGRAPDRRPLAPAWGPTALWGALLLLGAARPGRTADGEGCLRCHGMPTLARRFPTGEVQSLAVDARAFARSEHRRLECTGCHGAGYRHFPHPPSSRRLSCDGCHLERLRVSAPLVQASSAFRRSVHAQRGPHALTCRSCHDPHAFRRWQDVSGLAISQQNAVCLACHAAPAQPGGVASRAAPDITRAHPWLPYRERHLQHVRCLDCHSDGATPGTSHRILPARQAVRDCVACHSSQSILRQRWRRNRGGDAMARLGFLNAPILSHSYVVGATRNRFLDGLGLVVVLGTLAAAGAHGSLRVWASRRRAGKPRPSHHPLDQEAQR